MMIGLYGEMYRKLLLLAEYFELSEDELQIYFEPEGSTEKKSVLERLAYSLQDSGNMRNSIKFNIGQAEGNRGVISDTLCGFDAYAAKKMYGDWESIYSAVMERGVTDNGSGKNRETNWQKYCRGLYDGIKFLTDGKGFELIEKLAEKKAMPGDAVKRIKDISGKIHGLGFALTCDWLKECGCAWLSKPDTHILAALKSVSGNEDIREDEAPGFIFKWSDEVRKSGADKSATAYKTDKIIWLLCTGDFYLHGLKFGQGEVCRAVREAFGE